MKGCSTSFVIKKCKLKVHREIISHLPDWQKIQSLITPRAVKSAGKEALLYPVGGSGD